MKKLLFILFVFTVFITANAQEVSISGNKFIVSGNEIWFNGINTPWHLFSDFGRSDFDPTWWEDEFERYVENHINLARVWIHCSGDVSPDIDETGYVSGASDKFWEDMDHLIQVSRYNQVYVLPALFSFDITKNTYQYYERWRAWLQSPDNIQSYIDNVLIPMVQRYDDEPYLLAWEICNEPEWMFENEEHGPQSFSDVQTMHAMLAAAIHKNCSKMVTTGSAAPKWNSPIYDDWGEYEGNMFSDEALSSTIDDDDAYLDFYQYHWYPWQSEWFASPFTQTTVEYGVDDRPVIVGETEGNDVCDEYVCQTLVEMYENAYQNGFDGVCAWKTPQNDGHGTFENIAVATNAFYENHPDLVYPEGSEPVAVDGVIISDTVIEIEERFSYTLTVTVTPEDANDKRVSWSSSNTDVATVDDGLVTAVASGEAIITVTTNDGGYTASCRVTVTERAGGCSNGTTISLPFSYTGTGVYCWVTSGTIEYVNSWGTDYVEINGEDYTNTYSSSMPDRIDGKYYIFYEASSDWSHFEAEGSDENEIYYELTTTVVGEGEVDPSEGSYEEGTQVTLIATAADGYKFSAWSGDASGISETITITMDSDKSVTATFVEESAVTYELTTTVVGEGTVSPESGTYEEDTEVTLTAIPAEDYEFVEWSGDASGTSETITITMDSDKSVTVTFQMVNITPVCEDPITITIPFSQDGSGEYCWYTTDDIAYVSSWNLDVLEINGEDYTNIWSDSMPAKQDNGYYIYYKGAYDWSHFEAAALKGATELSQNQTEGFSLYPNPFNESITMTIDNPDIVNSIVILDQLGRQVKHIQKADISKNTIIGYDFENGIYLIKINLQSGSKTIVVVKQ